MISQFHFVHPLWLLALIPLAALLWLLYQYKSGSGSQVWDKVIDANLLPLLLSGNDSKTSRSLFYLLGAGWLVTVIALADPVWQKIPRPIFQTNAARVIVLDLSRSMLVPDLKPSRLARARFKIEDILSRKEEGQIGLVVFAGDAFTASPLTRDADTIRSLLQVLSPEIMPVQGSRADLGLAKAHELLTQAGINNGQVLLIADGVVGNLAEKQAKKLAKNGFTVSVLGVGTKAGGKIPDFSVVNGVPVIAKLDENALKAVASAGGGSYRTMSNSNADLDALLNPLSSDTLVKGINNDAVKTQKTDKQNTQDWKSTGPYLILLLIPLAALAFRRGWLFNIILLVGVSSIALQPQRAMAFSFTDLWQRPDQQADKALQQQRFEQASKLAKDPLRRGSAEYKQGNYQKALESFLQAKGADADYNRGNALAKLKKYQDAIKAYDQALKKDPGNQDAKANKAALEKLLKQQQQKKHKDQKQQNKQNKDNKNKNKNKQGNKKPGEQNKSGKKQESGDKKAGEKKQGKKDQQGKDQKDKQGEGGKNKKQQQPAEKGDKKQGQNQFSEAAKKLDKDKKSGKEKKQAAKQNGQDDDQKDTAQKAEKEAKSKEKKRSKDLKEANQKQKKAEKDGGKDTLTQGTKAAAEELSNEEKMAAEQWLRRIPDDPGGLLRRKFIRQYRQRQWSSQQGVNPW